MGTDLVWQIVEVDDDPTDVTDLINDGIAGSVAGWPAGGFLAKANPRMIASAPGGVSHKKSLGASLCRARSSQSITPLHFDIRPHLSGWT